MEQNFIKYNFVEKNKDLWVSSILGLGLRLHKTAATSKTAQSLVEADKNKCRNIIKNFQIMKQVY